jgi:hypothetical protein
MGFNYPLNLSFKIVALAPQMQITDASGVELYYVKQKLLKLKESVSIFASSSQIEKLFTIGADRIIDFNARYNFHDAAGNGLGGVKRQGMKSLWKSHYDVYPEGSETPTFHIQEEDPMVKVADGCLSSIPLLGMVSGYLFNPAYLVTRTGGEVVLKFVKEASFFEGKFSFQKVGEFDDVEESQIILSLMMMSLLERQRG